MKCPRCGADTVIIQLNESGYANHRVRGCNNCGLKFNTVEKVRVKNVCHRAYIRSRLGRDGVLPSGDDN